MSCNRIINEDKVVTTVASGDINVDMSRMFIEENHEKQQQANFEKQLNALNKQAKSDKIFKWVSFLVSSLISLGSIAVSILVLLQGEVG